MQLFLELVTGILTLMKSLGIGNTANAFPDKCTDYKVGFTPLKTNWTDGVGEHPWPEYPRPRMKRLNWKNLNGVWRYRNSTNGSVESPPFGEKLENPVLVPFCLESALSGLLPYR